MFFGANEWSTDSNGDEDADPASILDSTRSSIAGPVGAKTTTLDPMGEKFFPSLDSILSTSGFLSSTGSSSS